MLKEMLELRNLPPLKEKAEMLDVLQREEYGYLPPKPDRVDFYVQENIIRNFCAGNAVCNKVTAFCEMGDKRFAFPFYASMPTDGKKHPFFVHINFRSNIPDTYMPVEELIDNGFAVLSFNYEDVTSDNKDFTNGLAGVLYEKGKRGAHDAGKLALWAWAAQRVMDWAERQQDALDLTHAVVCGHSRLGKTAMLAAATDERFTHCYSNDSGSCGAAIARSKGGETVEQICARFPFWFCEKFNDYREKEEKMPFDQHYLAACIAPRKLLIGSASEDAWADPVAEMLCCLAASAAFEKGFVCEDRLPEVDDCYLDGDIGYQLRRGLHYFSRTDWQRLMQFVMK